MRRHGALVEAAICRSDRLRALLHDELLEPAGFDLVVEAHRAAARLDPENLTALCVEVVDRLDAPPTRHWCGEDGVAAAMQARLAGHGDRGAIPNGSSLHQQGTPP